VSNQLICSTVDQLNEFAATCEKKLLSLHYKMQRLEAEVVLLEGKLNSLPLSDVEPLPAAITGPPVAPAESTEHSTSSSQPASGADHTQSATAPTAPAPEELPDPEVPVKKVKDDPRFIKYFKMLSFGVPPPVVATAITSETGFPASLLDDPNAAAPPDSEMDAE